MIHLRKPFKAQALGVVMRGALLKKNHPYQIANLVVQEK